MLIQPDTNIRLIRNCPLNNKYEHTIYFETVEEQIAYFKSLPGKPFTKQSYQRYASGVLTVQVLADEIYDCNYLMFQNAGFGLKWFYAFITKVEYVNNITSKVYYELDVMQTWHFNYSLNRCFVEREHPSTDNIGDNLVNENIFYGDYVFDENVTPTDGFGRTMDDLSMVMLYNPAIIDIIDIIDELIGNQVILKSGYYSGVYHGLNFFVSRITEETVKSFDTLMANIDFLSGGGFVSCFIIPTMFVPEISGFYEYNRTYFMQLNRNTKFGSYTPKNNKLFTYPYTCAYLTSNRGAGNEFAFERFSTNGLASFSAEGNLSTNPSVMCYPNAYKGVDSYLEGAVTIPAYPVCSWGEDGLTSWINNNLFSTALSLAGSATASAVSASLAPATTVIPSMTGGAVKAKDVYKGGLTPDSEMMDAYIKQNVKQKMYPELIKESIGCAQRINDGSTSHGGASGDIMFGNRSGRKIYAMVKRITEEYAKIIDDYFTLYGYAVNRVKTPMRSTRPHWNYIKTKGCTITGSIPNDNYPENYGITKGLPSDDIALICDIYDGGITFWHKPDEIGCYFLDNSPKL